MSKPIKIILFVGGGFIVLVALVAVVLLVFVDTDAYRTRVGTAASNALGMEVRIAGSLGIDLWPGLHITLEDVHLAQQGAEVASVEKVRLGIDLLPLLQKKIRIGTLALKHPRISIERDRDGKFNFEIKAPDSATEATPGWPQVSLTEGALLFSDQRSGAGFEATDCSLKVDQRRPSGSKIAGLVRNLSFTAELACGEIRKNHLTLSAVKISATGANGVIDLKPATMRVFGAPGSGSLHADFSGDVPRYDIRFELPQFHVEEFFKTLSQQKVAAGTMDFSADLSSQGKTLNEVKESVMGTVSLRGQNIKLLGRDLDAEFSRFESSQNFNLVDVGAFFVAGPLGLLVTKGYNFASILQGPGGSSEIRTLVSDWQVEGGIARAQDVALATDNHRVALKGGLDLVKEKFNDLTLALIDNEGCTKVRQTLQGSFHDPQVEQPSVLRSLASPVEKILQLGRDLFPGGECELFYSGSVAPPE